MPPERAITIYFEKETWTENAACRTHPKDWWFPKEGQFESVEARKARAICHTCQVKKDCNDYAEKNGEMYGIWGGISSNERGRRRREANPRTKPVRARKTTRSPASLAIIDTLSDGRWHNYSDLVTIVEPHITPERIIGRYNRWARFKHLPEKTVADPEGIEIGLRKVIIDICHNLYQDGIVERNYGTVRLTSDELLHYHRMRNTGNGE